MKIVQALAVPQKLSVYHFLETRPDFKNQRTALQETVGKAGHVLNYTLNTIVNAIG
jgi:hypothetical protein